MFYAPGIEKWGHYNFDVCVLVCVANFNFLEHSDHSEHWTGDQRVASLRLAASGVTVLCPLARHFIRCLVLVQPRKKENRPDMT